MSRASKPVVICQPCQVALSAAPAMMTQHIFSKAHQVTKLAMASKTSSEYPVDDESPDFCHVCCENTGDLSEHCSSAEHSRAVSTSKAYLKHCEAGKLSPIDSPLQALRQFLEKVSLDDYQQIRKYIDHLHVKVDGMNSGDDFVNKPDAKARKISGDAFSVSWFFLDFLTCLRWEESEEGHLILCLTINIIEEVTGLASG